MILTVSTLLIVGAVAAGSSGNGISGIDPE
jgi:hypothetical protein